MRLLAIQPSGFVDLYVHLPVDQLRSLLAADQELCGSHRVTAEELDRLLAAAPPSYTAAGGSAANTLRGLAMGFGLDVGVVGAVGSDAAGSAFQSSMSEAGVDVSRLVVKQGCGTARCGVFITPDGQRTMRTAQDGAGAIAAGELTEDLFRGVEWVSFSCYAFFKPGLVDAIVRAARACKLKVACHLASWEARSVDPRGISAAAASPAPAPSPATPRAHREAARPALPQVVRNFWAPLQELLASGDVTAVFANEDEAREFLVGLSTSGRECAA